MTPSSEPSLRDRVNAALDGLTWEERTDALVTLLEEYGGEQARIAYRQGYQSAELGSRDALDRANALIRKMAPEALAAEVEAAEASDLLRDVMVDFVPLCSRADGDCECSANRARRYLLANGVDL